MYNTLSRGIDLSHILEAHFAYRHFDTDEAEANIVSMVRLKKLNLSNNLLDRVPLLPATITSLNLSFNSEIEGLHTFVSSRPDLTTNLKELLLQKTGLTTTRIFTSLQSLVSLNVADNLLTRIDGLEALTALRVLDLSNNHIKAVLSLRSLGCIKSLEILDLQGNPVSAQGETYRVSVLGFCSNLVEFDGKVIKTVKSFHTIPSPKVQTQRKVVLSHAKSNQEASTGDSDAANCSYVEHFDATHSSVNSPRSARSSIHAYPKAETSRTSCPTVFDGSASPSHAMSQRVRKRNASRGPSTAVAKSHGKHRGAPSGRDSLPWRQPPKLQPNPLHFKKHESPPVASIRAASPTRRSSPRRSNVVIEVDRNPPLPASMNASSSSSSSRVLLGTPQPKATPGHALLSPRWATPTRSCDSSTLTRPTASSRAHSREYAMALEGGKELFPRGGERGTTTPARSMMAHRPTSVSSFLRPATPTISSAARAKFVSDQSAIAKRLAEMPAPPTFSNTPLKSQSRHRVNGSLPSSSSVPPLPSGHHRSDSPVHHDESHDVDSLAETVQTSPFKFKRGHTTLHKLGYCSGVENGELIMQRARGASTQSFNSLSSSEDLAGLVMDAAATSDSGVDRGSLDSMEHLPQQEFASKTLVNLGYSSTRGDMMLSSNRARSMSAMTVTSVDGSLKSIRTTSDNSLNSRSSPQHNATESFPSGTDLMLASKSSIPIDEMLASKRLSSIPIDEMMPPPPPAPVKLSSPSLSHSRSPFSSQKELEMSANAIIPPASSDASSLFIAIEDLKLRKQDSLRRLEALRNEHLFL